MKKWISLILLFLPSVLLAQLELSVNELDFKDVYTNNLDSFQIRLTNASENNVLVEQVSIYNAVFTSSRSTIDIPASGTADVTFYFSPKQNMLYNSEAIFSLSNGQEYRVDLRGNGRYRDAYYSSTFNKSGEALKTELKRLISSGYTNLGYSGARDKMYGDIDNVNGKVTCVYTGRQATFNSRSGANSNSFNCEHTWPQSLFNSNEPERADIHHLFPTDVNSNSRRGNLPFGIVSSPTWTEGGSKVGGGRFEPREEQKGATARAMLYFAIRYTDYGNFIDNQEDILITWHKNNPPTTWDSLRNEKIFSYQKNRNPFVDHPELIERIDNFGSVDKKEEIKLLVPNQSNVDFGTINHNALRTLYFLNTGNTKIEDIKNLSTLNEHISIVDFDTLAEVGDAIAVTLGFKDQAPGSYSDELRIDIRGQNGQILSVPLSFKLETTSTRETVFSDLLAYYNPINHQIVLKNVPSNAENVEVYTISGRRILLDEISSSFTDIPFQGQLPGIYFVVIKTDKEVFTARFMVNH